MYTWELTDEGCLHEPVGCVSICIFCHKPPLHSTSSLHNKSKLVSLQQIYILDEQ